jgi:hypothetical protein
MATDYHLISRRNTHLLAVPTLPEVPFLLHRVHRQDYHHHEPILFMGVYANPNEIAHVVEELLPVFLVATQVPFTSWPSSSSSSVISSSG